MAVVCDFSGGLLDYDETVEVSISVRRPGGKWEVVHRHHVSEKAEGPVLGLVEALFDREQGSTAFARLTESLRPAPPQPPPSLPKTPKVVKPRRAAGTGRKS